jgi:ComF family protein
MRLKTALTPIVDVVFPPRCPLCGEALAEQGGLCVTCWSTLVVPSEPACRLCQRPLPPGALDFDLDGAGQGEGVGEGWGHGAVQGAGPVCAPCLRDPPRHAGIAAATLYNDTSRALVLAFKHGRRVALARLLARLMVQRIPQLEGEWLVIPVPLHRWRLWHRGYNQSALLAQEIAQGLDQTLLVDGLLRTKRTPSLGGLNAKGRASALSGAIGIHPGRVDELKGSNVLLVDDVLTTGATTDACLRALRKAKVAQVRITCFARVLDESPRAMPRLAVEP